MQDRDEDRPFDRELELPLAQQLLDDLRESGFLPEPLEDPRRADLDLVGLLHLAVSMGVQHRDVLGIASAGAQEPVQLTGLSQDIESPERGDDVLLDFALNALVADDLEILVFA